MSKKKKIIVSVVVFAVILAAVSFGLTLYAEMTPNTVDGISYLDEEEREEGTAYPVLEEKKSFGNAGYGAIDDAHGYYIPALEKADSKYIWIDESGEIFGVPKKTLQYNMMKADEKYSAEDGSTQRLSDVNKIMSSAEVVTYNFTEGYRDCRYKGKTAYYKYSNGGKYMEALGTVLPKDEEFSDASHNSNPLAERGLKLKMENIEVKKVLSSENYVADFKVVVQVSADVTCKKKSEVFDELDWIPEVGETKRINFVYYFGIDNRDGGCTFPKNIIATPEQP